MKKKKRRVIEATNFYLSQCDENGYCNINKKKLALEYNVPITTLYE